ncbi:hypothetical protein PAXRUDRAFT_250280 [Paxillus rubicundulus Ve08.2h10]|uniref:Uncharacterized protein n=1 Tax=Paxillus rubicundulus Ve08.2h10 TaxID=930991 RepID=A0A0D0DNC0_9AGAM|nr:hypothetical protein PAXRUDRAFT_250280 [Paxillus rubicundulus Ve08.2h10]
MKMLPVVVLLPPKFSPAVVKEFARSDGLEHLNSRDKEGGEMNMVKNLDKAWVTLLLPRVTTALLSSDSLAGSICVHTHFYPGLPRTAEAQT